MKAKAAAKSGPKQWRELSAELANLENHILNTTSQWQDYLIGIDPRYAKSACNLLQYTALRQLDLRMLQLRLSTVGLSISQCERFVLRNIREVGARIQAELGHAIAPKHQGCISWDEAKHIAHANSREVFATPLSHSPATELHQAIMITAAEKMPIDLCKGIIAAGASILRINAAHGTPSDWTQIIKKWRTAGDASDSPVKVLLDIAGPKLRTGRISMSESILHLKPRRKYDGAIAVPISLRIISGDSVRLGPSIWQLPLPPESIATIKLKDIRGRKRSLQVISDENGGLYVELIRSCYLSAGCRLKVYLNDGTKRLFEIESVDGAEDHAVINLNEKIKMVRSDKYEVQPRTLSTIECLEPRIFEQVAPGDSIAFDDGRIQCTVESVEEGQIFLRVTHTAKPDILLRSQKGINLPDRCANLQLLDASDLEAVEFGIEHADILSFSFVRSESDVDLILDTIKSLGAKADLPIVLKIETARGFANIARILLRAMRHYPISVMIARGDLAVEVGYMRSGEVQEQILSLAEAAHVPATLATEVLSNLLKTGSPSRAEVTDAAMSVRAECVMLNKGTYIVEATRSLRDILLRMQLLRYKNLELYRPTSWSQSL